MKNLILLLLTLGMTQAHAVTHGTFDGQWDVTDRVCEDTVSRTPPQDRFVSGRDTMVITVTGEDGTVDTTIDGERWVIGFRVDQMQQQIYSLNGEKDAGYHIDNSNQITMFTGNFGPGGSCYGRLLLTTLVRKTGR
jgi:hypothetical protein